MTDRCLPIDSIQQATARHVKSVKCRQSKAQKPKFRKEHQKIGKTHILRCDTERLKEHIKTLDQDQVYQRAQMVLDICIVIQLRVWVLSSKCQTGLDVISSFLSAKDYQELANSQTRSDVLTLKNVTQRKEGRNLGMLLKQKRRDTSFSKLSFKESSKMV